MAKVIRAPIIPVLVVRNLMEESREIRTKTKIRKIMQKIKYTVRLIKLVVRIA